MACAVHLLLLVTLNGRPGPTSAMKQYQTTESVCQQITLKSGQVSDFREPTI